MQILKAGALYFALVFGTGFLLGTIRTLWVVPKLGIRYAELLEMPFMLLAIFLVASWINRHLDHPVDHQTKIAPQVAVGILGLLLLLMAETIAGVGLQGLSVVEVFTKHDPISGTVYYVMLVVFAAMPWVLWKFSNQDPGSPC